jgi:hypothetical protein
MNTTEKDLKITSLIENVFKKHGKDFINLKTFLSYLDKKELSFLQLKPNSIQDAVEKAISPVKSPYQIKKFKQSKVLFNGPLAEIALAYIEKRKAKTFGQLNKDFPVIKGEFIYLVNTLLYQGCLRALISTSEKIILYTVDKKATQLLTETAKTEDADLFAMSKAFDTRTLISQFKDAYYNVGKGANYVFIHQIRNFLGWSRKQFDELLYQMMKQGYVAAHPGNPGALMAQEVRDSFQDEYGDLYITVSWRKSV